MTPEQFLRELRRDVLDSNEYGDVGGIQSQIDELQPLLDELEGSPGELNPTWFFETPQRRRLAALLLGLRASELRSADGQMVYAPFLKNWRAWLQGESLRAVVIGLLLAEAHDSRKDRRRKKFEKPGV